MKNFKDLDKKQKIVFISLVSFIVALVGVSFAYMANIIGGAGRTDVDLATEVSGSLEFTEGSPINLVANALNMAEAGDNLSGETTTTATYTASQDAVNETETYNAYFVVDSNSYIYTHNESTPEMILTLTDNENNLITSIPSMPELIYVTVTDAVTGDSVSGFDITTFKGTIIIEENIQIIASHPNSTTHEWKAKITHMNLDTNQYLNEGKELVSRLVLQKERAGLGLICLHKNIGDCFASNSDREDTLLQHTPERLNSAGDNNYRYSGGNSVVHNYVCFDSDEEECQPDKMYRIIGVYNVNGENLVKLTKYLPVDKNKDDIYTTNYEGSPDTQIFDSDGDNRWEGINLSDASDDADMNIYLNNTYYNELLPHYQEMIQESKFYIGQVSWNQEDNAKAYYDAEIDTLTTNLYKIGLKNVNDYMFGSSEEYWSYQNFEGSEPHDDSYFKNGKLLINNWLFTSVTQTLISPNNVNTKMWTINAQGHVTDGNAIQSFNFYPTFYLKSDIKLVGGSGNAIEGDLYILE